MDSKTVKILGKKFAIEECEDFGKTDVTMGRVDIKTGKIYIKANMPEDIKGEVLLHEVIHAICESLAIELTESQVTALSSGIFCVAVENNFRR